MNTNQPVDDRLSSAQKASPKLSQQMLTVTLVVMMAIPVVTILVMWSFLPAVHEGELEATVTTMGLPNPDFYSVPLADRPKFEGGWVVVRNNSDVDWTHLKMQVNHNYSTFDIEPIEAGTEKEFLLSKFITRDGKNFKIGYVSLNHFRIYARRPGGDRATLGVDFDPIETMKTNRLVKFLIGTVLLFLFLGVLYLVFGSPKKFFQSSQAIQESDVFTS